MTSDSTIYVQKGRNAVAPLSTTKTDLLSETARQQVVAGSHDDSVLIDQVQFFGTKRLVLPQ